MFAIIYLILYPNETPIHGRILNTSGAIYQPLLRLKFDGKYVFYLLKKFTREPKNSQKR